MTLRGSGGNPPKYKPSSRRAQHISNEVVRLYIPTGANLVSQTFRLRKAQRQLLSYPVQISLRTNSGGGAALAPIRVHEVGPRRRIYTIQPEGSAKRDISSGLPVRRWLASATYAHNPAVPCHLTKAGGPYESSTATAAHPTDDRGRGRLQIRAPWPN